jgi:predicted transposase YbfD/YdcC
LLHQSIGEEVTMAKYIPLAFEINLRDEGFLFDVGSLFEVFASLHDGRDARGIRYALTTILVFVVLAKLAGMDSLRAIAQWSKAHREELATWLGLAQVRCPHATTLSRILGKAIDVTEFERVVGTFFATLPPCGVRVHLILDGKTIRGTIPAGRTHGTHLLACYVPGEGWVWLQVAVSHVENEIPAALRLVKTLDLRGKIITGDALLAQRTLSSEIVKRKGDYVWLIKDNQPETLAAIEELFAPEPCVPGFSPASHDDFQTAETTSKGHGRVEKRVITVSAALQDWVNWPHAAQVFKLERFTHRLRDGKKTCELRYGLTSLTAQQASPQRLLELVRGHWQIENGLHYRRDDTFREDRCTLRYGHAAQMMAAINNLVLGVLRRVGWTLIPDARRHYAANLDASTLLVFQRLE